MAAIAGLVLLCLVAFSPAAQAAPARRDAGVGGVGIQLLEGPKNRESDPRAHQYIVDYLAPGRIIRRKLQLVNTSPNRQHVEVYPGAATLDSDIFDLGADREASELTSWISVDKGKVDLGPRSKAVVEATISVPAAASAGERYGVIWASVGSAAPAAGGVRMATRTGVRIYLDVGLGGEPRSDFSIANLTTARSATGDPSLAVVVTNTGARALDVSGSADLSEGPAGQRVGSFQTSTITLGLGATGTVIVQFPQALPNGPWKVELKLKSGWVNRTVTAMITFPDPGKPGKRGTTMSKFDRWSLAGGAVITGLILFVLVMLVLRHRRKSRRSAPRHSR